MNIKNSRKNPGGIKPSLAACRLWLTLRLIRNQKLRTLSLFCGILFSFFLLGTFVSFGYDFWDQVHTSADEAAQYDRTQWILICLVAVLLLLVAACAAVLLHNLFSLTFSLRWRSLTRLISLGAGSKDIVLMTVLEVCLLYCVSAPIGHVLTLFTGDALGIRTKTPFLLMAGIYLWIGGICCLCSIRPLWRALHRPLFKPEIYRSSKKHSGHEPHCQPAGFLPEPHYQSIGSPPGRKLGRCIPASKRSGRFTAFMTRKYRRADRSHHIRIVLTILAAIVLYVPVSYLVDTNISVQQAELDTEYGIQYTCIPRDQEEMTTAIAECRLLAATWAKAGPANAGSMGSSPTGDSLLYVSLSASAAIQTDLLSDSLLDVLQKAGWRERSEFEANSTVYFLEDSAYTEYLKSCSIPYDSSCPGPIILIDKYQNRSFWSEDAAHSYREVPLLNARKACSGIKVYYETTEEFAWDKTKSITPDVVTDKIPEGLDFGGNLSLILPLSWLESVLSSFGSVYDESSSGGKLSAKNTPAGSLSYESLMDIQVHGNFRDKDESTFSELEMILEQTPMNQEPLTQTFISHKSAGHEPADQKSAGQKLASQKTASQKSAGQKPVGQLRYTRKIFQEWYASMKGIRMSMTAICSTLFFIALLNVFSTMLFQYMERRKGLAILWSLGQSPRGLLKILAAEQLRDFLTAVTLGIPISGFLCYYIYGIFRQVWNMDFVLPLNQILLIVAALLLLSAMAVLVESLLMEHGDFLEDIKDVT